MSSGFLTPDPRLREFSDLGVVLPGAKLNTYVAGTPSTPLATYSDQALTVPNANPVVASAFGLFGPIYLTPGVAYKLVLTDATNVTVWTQDNVMVPGPVAGVTVAQGGTGVVTLAAHGVVIGEGTSPVAVTSPGTTGQLFTSNGAAADPTFQSFVQTLTLLKAASGTDTTAAATTVDSIAITGLTANDSLRVIVELITVTQNTAQVVLRNTTDGVDLAQVSQSPLASGGNPACMGEALLRQSQNSATSIWATFRGMQAVLTAFDYAALGTAVATNWTGSWTLGLRHGGVTAGGTLRWSWAVYKQAGQ